MHVDGLSHLSVTVHYISLDPKVEQLYAPSPRQTPNAKFTLVDGLTLDRKERILMEDHVAHHAVTTLHHTSHVHLGINKTVARFRYCFSYPIDHQLVESIVKQCNGCQVGENYAVQITTPGDIKSSFLWHTLTVDIFGIFPTSQSKGIIIPFIHYFSKVTILAPVANHDTATTAQELMN